MPTTAKAAETARRIAQSAAELFFTARYEDTTIAQVAEHAGVAVGTVMLHYGSKSELATVAFADRIASTVESASEAITGASLPADLDALTRPLFQWYADNRDVAGDLLKEALFATGSSGDYYASAVDRTVATFTEIAEQHRPHDEPQLVGESLLGDYLLVVLRGLGGAFDSVDAQVAHFLALATSR